MARKSLDIPKVETLLLPQAEKDAYIADKRAETDRKFPASSQDKRIQLARTMSIKTVDEFSRDGHSLLSAVLDEDSRSILQATLPIVLSEYGCIDYGAATVAEKCAGAVPPAAAGGKPSALSDALAGVLLDSACGFNIASPSGDAAAPVSVWARLYDDTVRELGKLLGDATGPAWETDIKAVRAAEVLRATTKP